MAARSNATAADERIQFRIGINTGGVIVEDGDIHGDGVNIAARLEGIAEPGGVCVSGIVHDQVQGRVDCAFADIGEQSLKNRRFDLIEERRAVLSATLGSPVWDG
jgi:class 3 adenylate cyclase